jgi:hypothetical protein
MNVYGTYIFTLLFGWVFVDIRIMQSYVMNWDRSKNDPQLSIYKKNTAEERGSADHKNSADIHLQSQVKGKLTNAAMVSV